MCILITLVFVIIIIERTYTLTARDNNDNEIYKVIDKNGKPAELSNTEDFDEDFENPNINITPL